MMGHTDTEFICKSVKVGEGFNGMLKVRFKFLRREAAMKDRAAMFTLARNSTLGKD